MKGVFTLNIGERIKKRRLELGYSVDDIAKYIGKNRATIYRYESSEIEDLPTSVLEPLAKALHTTPAYLMGWESQTKHNLKSINFNNAGAKVTEELTSEDIAEIYKTLPKSIENVSKALEDLKETVLEAHADNIEALIYYYNKLNHEGHKEILKRTIELNQIEKYTKQDNQQSQLALKLARKVNGDSELQTAEDNEADYINAPKNDIDM